MVDKNKSYLQKLGAFFGLTGDVSQADIDAALDAENAKKAAEEVAKNPPPKPEPTELEKAIAAAVQAQVAPLQAKIVELEARPNGAVQVFSMADAVKAGGIEKLRAEYAQAQKELAEAHYPFVVK